MDVEAFNASHEDYKIELIVEDGKCAGKDATAAAQKLVNVDQVKVILGGVCSAETLAAKEVTAPAGVVLLSAVSSNPDISKSSDYVYRFWSDIIQGTTISDQINSMGAKNIALLYEDTDYAIGLANVIKNSNPNAKFYEQKFASEEKDFPSIAAKVSSRADNLDLIIYIPSSDGSVISLLKALDAKGLLQRFKGKILTSEVGISNSVLEQIGLMTEGIFTTQFPDHDTFGDDAVKFINNFKAQHKVNLSEIYVAMYHEAFRIVADGITSNKYDNFNTYMKSITKDNPRTGLGRSYYFSGVDATNLLHFVMKKVENSKIVAK